MSDDSERTLDPTDQRKEQFRKEGRFARSRDAGGVVAGAAVLAVLAGSRERLATSIKRLFDSTLGDVSALDRLGPALVLQGALTELVTIAGIAVAAAVVASVVVGISQSGLRAYTDLAMPKLERLSPMEGLARLNPKKAALEAGVGLLRVIVVGAVAWKSLSKELPDLVTLASVPLEGGIGKVFASLGRVAGYTTGALFLISALDYAKSRYELSQQMKMTRKEREDEAKQEDGDAKAKAKMKAKARANARKRSMSSVKNADVIVTNPTHVAVALRYGPKDPAPIVLAKGHDEIALRIRAEARKHGIPILENRKLARALDAEVAVGRTIPAAHFAAVARVLAFVYKLRGKTRKATK